MGIFIFSIIAQMTLLACAQAIQSSWMETPEVFNNISAPDVSGGCNFNTPNEFGFLYAKSRVRFDENNPFMGLVTGSNEDPHYTLLVNSSYSGNIRNSTDEECKELFDEYESTQDYTQYLLSRTSEEQEVTGTSSQYKSSTTNDLFKRSRDSCINILQCPDTLTCKIMSQDSNCSMCGDKEGDANCGYKRVVSTQFLATVCYIFLVSGKIVDEYCKSA